MDEEDAPIPEQKEKVELSKKTLQKKNKKHK